MAMKYQSILPTAIRISNWLPKRHQIRTGSKDFVQTPFFVVSSGRTGTTLLASILDRHPEVLVPPEQFVISNAIIKYRLLNYLEWLDLVSIIVGEFARSKATMNWDLKVNDLIEELAALPKSERSLGRILDTLFRAYGTQHGAEFRIWGDKSPLSTDYMDLIYPVFPDAKYLGLVRDGRDVIASIYKKNPDADVPYATKKWNHAIAMQEKLRKKLGPDQFKQVRYEDLVREPQKVMPEICQFLGVPFDAKILETQDDYLEKLGAVGDTEAFRNVANPINPNSIGKWKQGLSEKQLKDLMPLIEGNLKALGYLD